MCEDKDSCVVEPASETVGGACGQRARRKEDGLCDKF